MKSYVSVKCIFSLH